MGLKITGYFLFSQMLSPYRCVLRFVCHESILKRIKVFPRPCTTVQHLRQPGTCWGSSCRGGHRTPFHIGVCVRSKTCCSPKGMLPLREYIYIYIKILDCHFRTQFNETNSISSCLASSDIQPSIPYIDILMERELWAPEERQFVLRSGTRQNIITAWIIHQKCQKTAGDKQGH